MNISQNEELASLTRAYQHGDIGQSEYRNRRRLILETLARDSSIEKPRERKLSLRLVKRVFWGTFSMLVLLAATVVVVKFLG